MIGARFAFCSSLVLAIVACAPSDGQDEKRAPDLPGGFELAAVDAPASREFAAEPIDFTNAQSEAVDVTVEDLAERLNEGTVFLIDVRTDEEVAEGIIPGAVHIALDEFAPSPALLEQADGRDIVIYCRSGRRSAIAARNLSGFLGAPAEHLGDGINGWKAAGEPVGAL
ncbi:rhodanese-like domain-containing protein [Erythrobacter sp. Alg231-14]|uniref:rhodanese-like domain-containing protein n=1 Tax=Erythrobacter sp. Alg231-14 TaxID=1922225 RepID=UPI000D55F743